MKNEWMIRDQLERYKRHWGKSGRRITGKASRWKRKGDIEALEWFLSGAGKTEAEVIKYVAELHKKLDNDQLFPTMRFRLIGSIRILKWVLK